jgi:hypothetical protein
MYPFSYFFYLGRFLFFLYSVIFSGDISPRTHINIMEIMKGIPLTHVMVRISFCWTKETFIKCIISLIFLVLSQVQFIRHTVWIYQNHDKRLAKMCEVDVHTLSTLILFWNSEENLERGLEDQRRSLMHSFLGFWFGLWVSLFRDPPKFIGMQNIARRHSFSLVPIGRYLGDEMPWKILAITRPESISGCSLMNFLHTHTSKSIQGTWWWSRADQQTQDFPWSPKKLQRNKQE